MGNAAKVIAALGALTGGYLKGKAMAEDQKFEREQRDQVRQDWTDKKELRDAIAGGIDSGAGSDRNKSLLNAGPTDLPDLNSGAVPQSADSTLATLTPQTEQPTPVQTVVARGASAAVTPKTPATTDAQDDFSVYVDRIAPRAMKTLVSQGRFHEAKAFNDFLETSQGQSYTRAWGGAMRKVSAGDFDGAVPQLEKLYSSVPDGKRAKATSLGDGRYRIDMLDEKTGDTLSSREMSAGDLSRQAIMALDPAKMAQLFVHNASDREKETAVLDRQLKLESLRQQGQDARDDRREERLQMRLDAQGRALERRLAAGGGGGGLTASQQRTNDSIIAARKQVTGMSQEEALRRTQPTTATGRENPDYDPALARTLKQAQSRLYGDDPEHDAFTSQRQSAVKQGDAARGQTPLQAAQAAISADPKMKGYTLGDQTPIGFEVLDANGRVIGHYGRQK